MSKRSPSYGKLRSCNRDSRTIDQWVQSPGTVCSTCGKPYDQKWLALNRYGEFIFPCPDESLRERFPGRRLRPPIATVPK